MGDATETELRRQVFSMFADIEEQYKLTSFVVVLCPGMYVYHKIDSVEFSMALMGQANAALEISQHDTREDLEPPGKIRDSHPGTSRYKWWTPVRKAMQKLSNQRGWYWFVVIMENAKCMFTSESACFPLTPEMRQHLLGVVNVLWEESQLADIAHARDNFQRDYMELARAAADQYLPEHIGVTLI